MIVAARAPRTLRYEQLAEHMTAMIERGALRPGDRLPSVRELSRQQRVSVSTVLESYQLLENRGLVEVRPQSGHYVRARRSAQLLEPRASTRRSLTAVKVSVSDLVHEVSRAMTDPEVVPLGAAVISAELLPTEKLNRMTGLLARDAGALGVAYPPAAGFPRLRRAIARRSVDWGCALAPDDIITTLGCMEALHLCLRAVTRAGDAIAVETPTFYGLLQLFEFLELKVCEVPAHPRTGIDLEQLEATLKAGPVKACVLTANFNNPLGTLMPDEHKERLCALLARHEVPLIDDDIYGDLAHDGSRPRPVKAFDKKGMVMLCGSVSKTIAPGYRVGWVAPGRWLERVERLKFAHTVASPAIPQMAIAEYLDNGGYDHHLRQLRRRLAANLQCFTDAVAEHFPPGTRVSRPQGGFVLWIELPAGLSSLDLYAAALDEAICVAPGPIFSAKQRFTGCIRLNCGHLWSEPMERSIRTLGRLAHERLPGA
jgi:DNA-binding transcriptional MocR family regulator